MTELQNKFRRLKISKHKFEYDMALRVVKGERVHTIKRFSNYGFSDFTKNVVQIMNDLGMECEVGSDAPRGGKIGT